MFDLLVIGAGPGGYVAAIRAAQLGLRVAIVDKRENKALGGTCLNVGCIPSKALLDSSELYETTLHKLSRHGIHVAGVHLELGEMLRRKDGVVKSLTDGIAFLMKKNKITTIHGSAKLVSGTTVEVNGETHEAKTILLATGSESVELPFLKYDGVRVVTSTEALNFNPVPKHLIVVGAGYIGLELGSVWKRLGAKVTVLEYLPRILPISDGEVASAMQKVLTKQGIEFHLQTKVTGAKVHGDGVTVTAVKDGQDVTFDGDRVLVAVGRRPYTAGLNLEAIGISVDARSGRVSVDREFRTGVPSVYAIGDLIVGPMLAHKASEEGIAFAERLAGKKTLLNYDCIPSVIYTWPEVASVGLTEEQLKELGKEYRVGKFPFAASGRAKAMDETDGFVKVLTDKITDRMLGLHIMGPRASDLIAEAVAICEYQGSGEDLARMIHGHPSLSESVGEAARTAWQGMTIHA